MSNPNAKNKLNVAGPWFCTDPDDAEGEGCIACGLCYEGAPKFYAADDDGNAYIKNQPVTEEDIAACQEQLEACPVESIGKNG